ncbi:MAG: 1-acyl-sn-glycerol-3-phosphate acyltransferase [Actinomycetota bacterium]|nr:1-acyl-sn-glycerol-3-phosphate acyltransferase [Actinomycetota bacterium]
MRPPVDESVERTVAEVCDEVAPAGHRPITPDASLADLGLDSLGLADLAVALEERFGVRLARGDVGGLRTVQDVAATVQQKVPVDGSAIPPGIGSLQSAIKSIIRPVFRWHSRLNVTGEEHVPSTGPAIVAANHRSMLDVPLLVLACPRPITFMGKRELFGDPIRRWAFHTMGGFPVRREIADIRAIDVALAVLKRGEVLGMYPEGTRSRTRKMLPLLKGAAWLALRTAAPIVPCGITGTERDRPPGAPPPLRKNVRIAFGPPLQVNREDNPETRRRKADEVTEELLHAITALLAE